MNDLGAGIERQITIDAIEPKYTRIVYSYLL